MARKKRGRPVNGVILLDKPVGITSNNALQTVKGLYFAAKAGHTGSLDPIASGMLPICFGEATKLSQFLLEEDKCYEVEGTLGAKTETGDIEGEVIESHTVLPEHLERLPAVLPEFTGDILQVPSMYSALKHNGTPLYKLARQGITVERQARPIKIYQLDLLGIEENKFKLFVSCSKGTYIRSLVEDVGDKLGCGAHVSALRRTSVGGFHANQMIQLPDLQKMRDERQFESMDDLLKPLDQCLPDWPIVTLDNASAYYFMQGQSVLVANLPSNDLMQVMDEKGSLLGVATIDDDGKVAPKRIINH